MWLLPAFVLSAEWKGDSDKRRKQKNHSAGNSVPQSCCLLVGPRPEGKQCEVWGLHPPAQHSHSGRTRLQHIRHDVAGEWWQTTVIKMFLSSTVPVVRETQSTSKTLWYEHSQCLCGIGKCCCYWPQKTEMLGTRPCTTTPSLGPSAILVTHSEKGIKSCKNTCTCWNATTLATNPFQHTVQARGTHSAQKKLQPFGLGAFERNLLKIFCGSGRVPGEIWPRKAVQWF